ncbi:MAG: EamA family transporter [Rhodomicrobium sp.]|jgi:drug/metabolite transporter (DMT)-like permease
MSKRLRWSLTAGLIAAALSDTLLQLAWKTAVLETPSGPANLAAFAGSLLVNPLLIGIVALMIFQLFNWLFVLAKADLSYAKPVASLSYACVPALSALTLNEPLDAVEILGVVFVVAGVWFIGQTEPSTRNASKLP